jgi:hypothetical protein
MATSSTAVTAGSPAGGQHAQGRAGLDAVEHLAPHEHAHADLDAGLALDDAVHAPGADQALALLGDGLELGPEVDDLLGADGPVPGDVLFAVDQLEHVEVQVGVAAALEHQLVEQAHHVQRRRGDGVARRFGSLVASA